MNRMVLGAVAALLMVSAGIFWWQGRAEVQRGVPPPDIAGNAAAGDVPIVLPSAGRHGRGAALPVTGAKSAQSAEDRKFNRYDKNHDGDITRTEMLATRVKAFQKLDVNHDNLLSFEEWAVKTSNRFKDLDANGDGIVTRAEFDAYQAAHVKKKKPSCACSSARAPSHGGKGEPQGEDSEGDAADPGQ